MNILAATPRLQRKKKKVKLIYEIKLTAVSANGYQSAHFIPILSDMDVLSRPLASLHLVQIHKVLTYTQ